MFTAPPWNRWIDVELITCRDLRSQPRGWKACWVGGEAPSCPSLYLDFFYSHKYTGTQKPFMTMKTKTHSPNTHMWWASHRHRNCEDKGAVVARQQVSLAPTHLEPVLLRSLSDCLPRPEVKHSVQLKKTRKGEEEENSLMELKTQTELAEMDTMTFYSGL